MYIVIWISPNLDSIASRTRASSIRDLILLIQGNTVVAPAEEVRYCNHGMVSTTRTYFQHFHCALKLSSKSLVYLACSRTLFLFQLILILVSDLPHLTQLMPGRAERVLKLQDFNLKITQESSVNCAAINEMALTVSALEELEMLTCCSICRTLKSWPLSLE